MKVAAGRCGWHTLSPLARFTCGRRAILEETGWHSWHGLERQRTRLGCLETDRLPVTLTPNLHHKKKKNSICPTSPLFSGLMQHIMCTKGASFNVVPANVELISLPYTRHVWTGWAMSASRFSANLSPRQSSLTWHRPPFLFPCGEHVCLSARKSYLSLCGVFFLDILYVWYVHTDYRQLCLMQFIVQRPTKKKNKLLKQGTF